MFLIRPCIVALVLLPAVAAAGEVYKCTAADGAMTFQATPCPDDAKEDRRRMQSASSASEPASRASSPADDDVGAPPTSCRSEALKIYEGVPKEIEAYYKKRTRQCRENFHTGSFQIKNCFQEQKEIKAEKYKELEGRKKRALADCNR